MFKRKAEDEDDSVVESKFSKDNVDSDDDEDEEFNDKKKYEILKEDDIEGRLHFLLVGLLYCALFNRRIRAKPNFVNIIS